MYNKYIERIMRVSWAFNLIYLYVKIIAVDYRYGLTKYKCKKGII